MNELSASKIYWTEDYSQFNFVHGNRDLNEAKIKKLIKDVENGMDLFKYCPILVTETFHIIDGQHRFFVCKKLKKFVYYIIVPNFTLSQIARLNNNQTRWKMQDFLNCYIDAGKNSNDYKILKTFSDNYKLTISTAVSLLYVGVTPTGGSYLEIFREGKFKANFLDKATSLLDTAGEYSEYTDVYNTREFLHTLQKLLLNGMYSHAEMLNKLKINNLRIEKRTNSKEYLAHMEELFNFKNSKRKTIY